MPHNAQTIQQSVILGTSTSWHGHPIGGGPRATALGVQGGENMPLHTATRYFFYEKQT